jgi:undecaprenyl-diphosphatase
MSIWLLAIILGIVEGLTEFIPVSSTGHLLIAEHMFKVGEKAPFLTTEVFNCFIQVWAMIAALPLFRDRLGTLCGPRGRGYLAKLFVSFCVTVAGVLLFKAVMKKITGHDELLPKELWPVSFALLIGGVLFVIIERWLSGKKLGDEVTWTIAIVIGIAQVAAAVFPGTSRSGATILCALALGLGRGPATEFSFLLGVPTLGAAAVKTLWDAHKAAVLGGSGHMEIQWLPMLLTSAVAAVVSFAAVRWMLGYVRTHTFTGFGWYRIGLAVILIALSFTAWH